MKHKVLMASLWSVFSRFGVFFIDFVIQILLARILFPSDFGVIASLAILISLGNQLSNFGLGQALIQNNRNTYLQECTIFYVNIIIGLTIGSLIYLFSSAIAGFYDNDILIDVTKIYSIYFIVNSFSLIQDSMLSKKLDFKSKFFVNIASVFISGVLAIILSLNGFSYWALVFQIIIKSIIRTLLLWKICDWRPSLLFSFNSIRSLLRFGFNMVLSSIFTSFRINIFAILIGKSYNFSDLGFYNRANQLQNITSKTFTTSLQNVLFPVFSQLQDDIDLLKKGLKKSIKFLFFIITPLMVFFIVNAEDIIVVLLTDKWIESAKYLKTLSLLGIVYPLQMMNLNVLKAISLSKKFLYMTLLWNILSISFAIMTSFYSIKIMILGQVVVTLICYLINVLVNGKYYSYYLKEQLKDLMPLILINVAFYLVLNTVCNINLGFNLYFSMLINVMLSSLIYGLIVYLFYRPFFIELMNELKVLIKKKN